MPTKKIFLKGIDYFQLLIDHHAKRKGGLGHEARLLIFLEGRLQEEIVYHTIHNNPVCKKLASARISKTHGLGYPSLYFADSKEPISINFYRLECNEIPEDYFHVPVDVYHKPPLHIQVFYFADGNSAILFSLHHILFDFAGVQSLVRSLAGKTGIPLLPDQNLKLSRPFATRFNAFFKAVAFTFKEANYKMTVAENRLPDYRPLKTVSHELRFTVEETLKVYLNCSDRNVPLNRSIFFLAVVSKAMHDNIFSRQKKHRFLWVPVPVNVRRKGTSDAILFNGLSFLFYKLRPVQLSGIQTAIDAIKLQMKFQVQNDMPNAFIDFADGYRFMPMPFYYPMLKLPSWGKLSSFSFSVLGDTFVGLNEFMGLPVTDIINYPSNSIAPGFTFLFYEFKGELRIMSSWVKDHYPEKVRLAVINEIKKWLLDPLTKNSA